VRRSLLLAILLIFGLFLSLTFGQTLTATAKYGKPKIDAEMDEVWKNAEEYVTDRYVQG